MTSLRLTLYALLLAAALWLDPLWAPLVPVALFMPVFGTSCTIFSDDFSTDQLATAYDTRSGSWSVSGGVLSTSSASALLVANTGYGAGATGVHVTASITCATTSDIGRVIACHSDDNNYWFAEVQPGATNGTLKLYERSGGTNTQRGSTQTVVSFNATEALTVCMSIASGYVIVTVTAPFGGGSGNSIAYAASPTVASTKVGLGSGSGSSSVAFGDFAVKTHRADDSSCSECSAIGCTSLCSSAPAVLYITLAGIPTTADCLPANTCDWWNSTFAVPVTSTNACQGSLTFAFNSGDCSSAGSFINWLFSSSGGHTILTVTIGIKACTVAGVDHFDTYIFSVDLGPSPVSCLIDTDVAFSSYTSACSIILADPTYFPCGNGTPTCHAAW